MSGDTSSCVKSLRSSYAGLYPQTLHRVIPPEGRASEHLQGNARSPREALRGGISRSFLEPFCGHLSPKVDRFSEELTLRYPHEGPCVERTRRSRSLGFYFFCFMTLKPRVSNIQSHNLAFYYRIYYLCSPLSGWATPSLPPKRQGTVPPLCPPIGNLVTDGNRGSAGNRFRFPDLAKKNQKKTALLGVWGWHREVAFENLLIFIY